METSGVEDCLDGGCTKQNKQKDLPKKGLTLNPEQNLKPMLAMSRSEMLLDRCQYT